MDFNTAFKTYVEGMKGMTDIAITLILAWSMGKIISELGTAEFIVSSLQSASFSPAFVPAVIFVFGACASFATGSSWGTFALMRPLALPLAHAFGIPYHIAVAAVLSGGLFGDHCSPISSTTILSATGAGCTLVDHVKTQLPYAGINGAIAFVAYILAGITRSEIVLVFAVVALVAVTVLLNRITVAKMAKAAKTVGASD